MEILILMGVVFAWDRHGECCACVRFEMEFLYRDDHVCALRQEEEHSRCMEGVLRCASGRFTQSVGSRFFDVLSRMNGRSRT